MRFRLGTFEELATALSAPPAVAGVEIADLAVDEGADVLRWRTTLDVLGPLDCSARGASGRALVTATGGARLPYFGWILAPLLRLAARDGLRRVVAGSASRPWWAPPVRIPPQQAAV